MVTAVTGGAPGGREPLRQHGVGCDAAVGAQRGARAVRRQRLVARQQRAQLEVVAQRAAGADPDQARAPRAISSSHTIAALGPPIPVDWTVSGSPSAAVPV